MGEKNTVSQQKTKNGGHFMKKFIEKRTKNEKGMTLVELLAVIVILAIIAAIAVPAIGSIINNSKDSAKLAAASNILAGAKIAATSNDCTEANDGSVLCEQDDLKTFVDNVKGGADATYSAARDDEGNWTVTYSELKDFNSKKHSGKVTLTGTSITEENLNKALNN